MTKNRDLKRNFIFCILLILFVFGIYYRTFGYDFIEYYDDFIYITQNRVVLNGLSIDGLKWAFSSFHAGNWHPLTWLSHMTDVQLFGIKKPGLHHLINVLFHISNTLLLFLLFNRLLKKPWLSFFIAAFFAVHPSRVESVAWIAERKDVLSTLFMMLTLLMYEKYAATPGKLRYLLTGIFLVLGLMSKPMLVTLPILMILLDFWPLRRFEKLSVRSLIIEKVPFNCHIVRNHIHCTKKRWCCKHAW